MAIQEHWVMRVLRFVTHEEIKTPLSFLFKVVPWLVLAVVTSLFAPIGDDLKLTVIKWILWALLGLCVAVLGFAWFRPRNLVYGESGHRAERKLEFGNELRQIDREELDALPGTSNPEYPLIEDK